RAALTHGDLHLRVVRAGAQGCRQDVSARETARFFDRRLRILEIPSALWAVDTENAQCGLVDGELADFRNHPGGRPDGVTDLRMLGDLQYRVEAPRNLTVVRPRGGADRDERRSQPHTHLELL